MRVKMLLKISFCILFITSCNQAEDKKQVIDEPVKQLRALIVDGQNNHGVWPKTTMMMKSYLEETGLFQVDIYRTAYTYQGPHHGIVDGLNHDSITQLVEKYRVDDARMHEVKDSIIADTSFKPEFDKYDVILSNFGDKTANWPEDTKEDFESYMKNGGGLVVVHGANNSWGDWPAFNNMIGVGGWGNRPHEGLSQIYINREKQLKIEPINGEESSHGPEKEFVLTAWDTLHPITRGLPKQWMHTKDELYDRLRGPARNVNVLYYAYSDVEGNAQPWAPENKGSGRGEPLIMTINYEKGRVFHTALGHMDVSMESAGFITTLQRGAEWAATGNVTQEVPSDFPTKKSAVRRSWR